MKYLITLFNCMIITACGTHNNIQQIIQPQSITPYKAASVTRFTNLYPKKPTYPENCTDNCYPNTASIQCEQEKERCQYIGKQVLPKLNVGFDIQWLGHASFLIRSPDGSQLLFDPVSEQFDWPVNWAFWLSEGFNRQPPVWPTPSELAKTNMVLYSHIHYDHFNKRDIAQLGQQPEYIVPLGFAEHFPAHGYRINEMAWFSNLQRGDLTVSFVPAHHFSNRIWVPYLYEDDNTTLWGGWVIEYQGKRLFFAGDTGYSAHFKDIQNTYGDMDICLLPIASYYHKEHGDWYRYVHTTPEDALTAAKDLNCKVMIPWGYGNASWKMGDHNSHSALQRLLHMHSTLNADIPLYILNEGDNVSL
ncbi:MBL fold metallo-hydrolase [uncultured Shewanella sp.]|uniref:MBL fold metallo-hydrolase n=1 Tax=uncultured Shewanella sp. TaxID=173975 RepID=UPI00260E24AB|nr:MBL fold metallo-hydrolase [uncultured Shewanella sp.]